jgi:hypothetical protein
MSNLTNGDPFAVFCDSQGVSTEGWDSMPLDERATRIHAAYIIHLASKGEAALPKPPPATPATGTLKL